MSLLPVPTILAETPLPTHYGNFNVISFKLPQENVEHMAIIRGNVSDLSSLPVRVHSECFTSEVLSSLKCDCKEQLESAMKLINHRNSGIIVYLRQEGRGIGLNNKLKAYALQAKGYDTVDANRMLGLPDDIRDYTAAATILNYLNVKSIHLITNNPLKIKSLKELGINVISRYPSLVETNQYSANYLETKKIRMGHIL